MDTDNVRARLPQVVVCFSSVLVLVALIFMALSITEMSSLEVNKWNKTTCQVNYHLFGDECCEGQKSITRTIHLGNKVQCVEKTGNWLKYRSHVSKCGVNQVNMTAGTYEGESRCVDKEKHKKKIESVYGEHRCWVDCDALVFKLIDPKEEMKQNLDSLIIWSVVLWLSGSVCYCQGRTFCKNEDDMSDEPLLRHHDNS